MKSTGIFSINMLEALFLSFLVLGAYSQQFPNTGCSQFDANQNCIACQNRYYLSFGVCMPVSPLCLTYSATDGSCTSCFAGYYLMGANCYKKTVPNCLTYNSSLQCQTCENRYYLSGGACLLVDPKCDSYKVDGSCTTCIAGYLLYQGQCFALIPNCLNQVGTVCQACNPSYVVLNNQCVQDNSNCQQYNTNGTCVQCTPPLVLAAGVCLQPISNCLVYNLTTGQCQQCDLYYFEFMGECAFLLDPNCQLFQGQTCLNCSKGYFFGTDNRCKAVSTLCASYEAVSGLCTSCFTSYVLQNGTCLEASELMDPNCYKFSGMTCLQCSQGYRFNSNGTCVQLDPLCWKFNLTDYSCLQCYQSFTTYEVYGPCLPIQEAGCKVMRKGQCFGCYKHYYLQGGHCHEVDPYCSSFNFSSLQCDVCFKGYRPINGSCQRDDQLDLCKEYSLLTYACTSCYKGYYLSQGRCVQADPLCATYDPTNGKCASCYLGYVLIRRNGVCYPYPK